jgi:hypothetical protein
MSIATLKRKTQTEYNRMSVGYSNFSLNGTRRNQGYVGQTMLSRSLPKTPMVGNTPKGYGGCCGTYRITPIVQSAVTSTNDSSVIKSSVLDNFGMLQTKYRWVRRPQPFSVTKPDSNLNNNSESSHIYIVKQNALNCNAIIDASTNPLLIGKPTCDNYINNQSFSGLDPPVKICSITKSDTYTGAIDQGVYIQNLDSGCTNNKVFPLNTQNAPFSCQLNSTQSADIINNTIPYDNQFKNYSKNYSVNLG